MRKSAAKTTLYRLIEAGHLARHAMLAPLKDLGLEAGDDAILFGLLDPEGATETDLCELTGLDSASLEIRLSRLGMKGVLDRLAVGPHLLPGARLTERGAEIADLLMANWEQLDDALTGELDSKTTKQLRRVLKRFVKLLNI